MPKKRDQRFYPKYSVIVFNQKVRQAAPGASGKLLGIVKIDVLVELDGKCVTVANKVLDKITVSLPREIPAAAGERLHLKANRNLSADARTTNGELVTVKSVRTDGGIELADGGILGKEFGSFSLVMRSRLMVHRAKPWITFYFPTPRSRWQRMPNNVMSPSQGVGVASAFSRRIKFNCVKTWFAPATGRWQWNSGKVSVLATRTDFGTGGTALCFDLASGRQIHFAD